MLDGLAVQTDLDVEDTMDISLVHLTHRDLLSNLRQVNGKMTRELMNSADTLRMVDLDDAPVAIDMRRFCELMAPYLCMN